MPSQVTETFCNLNKIDCPVTQNFALFIKFGHLQGGGWGMNACTVMELWVSLNALNFLTG